MFTSSGSSSALPIVWRGFSEANGFWNTIWISVLSRARVAGLACSDIFAVDQERARGRNLDQSQKPRQRRFPGAGFADHRQRSPGPQRKGHAVERMNRRARAGTGRAKPNSRVSAPSPRVRRSRMRPLELSSPGNPPTSGVRQRARPSAGAAGGGSASWQASKTKAQRGENRQPRGRSNGPGTMPGIAGRRRAFARSGNAARSAAV